MSNLTGDENRTAFFGDEKSVLPRGDEDSFAGGVDALRDFGRNRDIRDLIKDMDDWEEGGLLDVTVVDDADAGRVLGFSVDVVLDMFRCFKEERVGGGGSASGDAGRREDLS